MRLVTKNWMGREDGRIMLVKGCKVIFSTHYRNLGHKETLLKQMNKILSK